MRRIRSLAVAISLALGLTACAAPAPEPTVPAGDGPLVAFYGDSYTLGTGLDDLSQRWSTILSDERGWREFNPSVNGLGFVNNRSAFGDGSGDLPDLIIAERPDIVFVTMGLNDTFSFDRAADRIRTTIEDDLARLRGALPDARIIVVEPFWYTDERPRALDTIIDWTRDAAAGVDADWIPGASRWLDGHYAESADSWMAADGLHPDTTGYRVMAERMDEALARLDPPL
ncbi:MAG: SGNH/GDSL hydrolase family protein [Microbacteriaceae bacterium]